MAELFILTPELKRTLFLTKRKYAVDFITFYDTLSSLYLPDTPQSKKVDEDKLAIQKLVEDIEKELQDNGFILTPNVFHDGIGNAGKVYAKSFEDEDKVGYHYEHFSVDSNGVVAPWKQEESPKVETPIVQDVIPPETETVAPAEVEEVAPEAQTETETEA